MPSRTERNLLKFSSHPPIRKTSTLSISCVCVWLRKGQERGLCVCDLMVTEMYSMITVLRQREQDPQSHTFSIQKMIMAPKNQSTISTRAFCQSLPFSWLQTGCAIFVEVTLNHSLFLQYFLCLPRHSVESHLHYLCPSAVFHILFVDGNQLCRLWLPVCSRWVPGRGRNTQSR